ncbi:MAG: hypothetical protein KDE55_02725, partial [Novosphingobium sp.]|nr:hypothetical protein [Novosphingobium sp.]
MSRIAKSPTFDPKVYRHFAIITVIATGCLALFADGENKEYVREQTELNQSASEARKEQEAKGKAEAEKGMAFKDGRSTGMGFSGDPGPPTSSSTGYAKAKVASTAAFRQVASQGRQLIERDSRLPDILPPGMSKEEFQQLLAKRKAAAKVMEVEEPSENDLESILDASRRRSGENQV